MSEGSPALKRSLERRAGLGEAEPFRPTGSDPRRVAVLASLDEAATENTASGPAKANQDSTKEPTRSDGIE